jgi:pilus assembly protein CpaD
MRVGMNGPAISPEIEAAVRAYALEYRADGTGAITIQVPTGSANEVAATSTGRAVHYALVRAGVPERQIRVAPYAVNDLSTVSTLRVSYLRVKAVVPRCGVWPELYPTDHRNAQYHNFACAQQQNLAAMVANPADLIRPQPMAPASGARRAGVITAYGQGEDTRSNVILIESGIGG